MLKFKTKKMALAVGTILSFAASIPSAQAVNLATDGLGQALIIPYYTTRAGWNTLINITNTSNQVVVAKVSFFEGHNSRDIFDFNVIMSPHDVWNGTVSAGPGGVPLFSTLDTSCTAPAIPAGGIAFNDGVNTNGLLAYTGPAADGGPATLDRMSEGYIAVTMMGTSPPTGLANGAVHTAAGVPNNCSIIASAFALQSGYNIDALRAAFPNYAVNPLKGAYSLVNASNGWNASASAITLADFYAPATPGANLITAQLDPARAGGLLNSFHEPNLNSSNTVGQVLREDGILDEDPAGAVNAAAVSYVLSRASIVNQWANLAASASNPWNVRSDWVITFPTKRYYVDNPPAGAPANDFPFAGRAPGRTVPAGPAPFSNNFAGGRSCDAVSYTIYNREERQNIQAGGPIFSPAPSPQGNELCKEVNVLTFGAADGATNVLRSPMGNGTLSGNVDSAKLPGANGWMQLNFENTAGALPAVSFVVINRTEPSGILNESFIVDAAYKRINVNPDNN